MATTYSSGVVTAYGAALEGGFAGTYADFCQLMATLPTEYGNIEGSIAQPYSSSNTYPNIGTYVWHNGILYKNIVPITTAETWTASHWTITDIGGDIVHLRNVISSKTGNLLPDYSADSWTSPTSILITRNGYTLIINGTKENAGAVTITDQFALGAGSYEFGVGENDALTDTGAFIQIYSGDEVIAQTQTKTSLVLSTAKNVSLRILLNAGSTFNNLSVKPMLFSGSIPNTYVPQVSAHDYVARKNVGEALSSISNLTNATAPAYSSSATYSVGDYVWHDGALYRCTTAITTAESWTAAHWTAAVLGYDVSDLKSAIKAQSDEIHEITETYTPHNLYDYTKVEQNKYLNPNGTIENYNGRLVTDYIPAKPGKYIVGSYIAASNNSVTRNSYSAICCYDENKNVVTGGDYNKSAFLVPSGVAYVRITYNSTMLSDTAMVENSDTNMPTTFEYYHEPTKFIADGISVYPPKMGYMIARGDIVSDGSLYLPVQNVKNDNVLTFTANVSTFDSIQIGKSEDAIVTIDSTNITIHNDQGDYTEAHGLTIENNIQILITNKTDVNADIIRIASNGQSHTVTGTHRFIMDEGRPFVKSVGTVLTNAVFAWTSRNINKPIWLFGDSYFSWYASRWTYYLAQDGYTKSCMLNGLAGETVEAAMTALRSLLTVRTPNIVVWCMGMNNADWNDNVNAKWKNAYDELVGLSKSYGFELILATIPNTPTVNNSYKNDIVINSGYRYIDFAKAVNIPGTSNWYSGMLANDNVHPTAQGAVSLYGQVLSDFPEITSI